MMAQLCPGDIFHPDFQHGCSAYFDVYIRSTTQPAYISSSVLRSVAAAAGELAKDEKHLAAVVKVGADFIPLVVETFRPICFAIFKHHCCLNPPPCSGVPPKLARKNLVIVV